MMTIVSNFKEIVFSSVSILSKASVYNTWSFQPENASPGKKLKNQHHCCTVTPSRLRIKKKKKGRPNRIGSHTRHANTNIFIQPMVLHALFKDQTQN